jgi:hypothetical protein
VGRLTTVLRGYPLSVLGVLLTALGGIFWIAAGGPTPTGICFLLIAAFCIPGVFAHAAIRRQTRSQGRPLHEQRVFRLQGLVFAPGAVAFLLVALWSRRVGGDAVLSEVLGFLMAGLLAVGALVDALVVRRLRRRAEQGPGEQSKDLIT